MQVPNVDNGAQFINWSSGLSSARCHVLDKPHHKGYALYRHNLKYHNLQMSDNVSIHCKIFLISQLEEKYSI